MDPQTFVDDLHTQNRRVLDRLAPADALSAGAPGELTVTRLLQIALTNEMEAAQLAASWMPTTPEVDAKMGFARQCGDEAKHFRMISDRLRALGVDPAGVPVMPRPSPLYTFLLSLSDTVERVAAGQFTREAIALVKNRAFIELCESKGDRETAQLYREVIQPDEEYHHQLGRLMLLRYADTPEKQDLARRAATRTLELAEELTNLAAQKLGTRAAPGC